MARDLAKFGGNAEPSDDRNALGFPVKILSRNIDAQRRSVQLSLGIGF
jgi:hypothetical protein